MSRNCVRKNTKCVQNIPWVIKRKDGKKIKQSLGTEQSYLVIDSFVFVYREIFQRIVKKVKERYWKFVF